jgi:predicted component of viral defense system (DUF524 family)
MVLLKRPPYRAALQGYLELHRSPFVSLDDPALATPLINLPSLYQTWGTLQLVDAVLGVAADLGYELISQTLVHRAPGELYVRLIPNGSPVLCLRQRETGTRVDIIPERTYGHTGSLRSLTYEQRPDIAIEIRAPERSPQVLVLDPKYKLDSEWEGEIRGGARPVKTDLDKMHAYRDAIRDDSGRHVVRYAAILYPGDAVRYPPGEDLPQVEALRAYPGDETALRERLQTVLNAALT